MKSKKFLLSLLSILVISGLAYALKIFYVEKKSNDSIDITGSKLDSKMHKVYDEKDLYNIQRGNATEEELIIAFSRQARNKNPEVFERGIELFENASVNLKKVILESLSYSQDENAFNLIRRSLDDKDLNIRISAIKALGGIPTPEKISEINRVILEANRLSDLEKVHAYDTYYRFSNNLTSKNKSIDELLKIAKDGNDEAKHNALLILMRHDGLNQNLLTLLEDNLVKSKNGNIIATSIRHLAATKIQVLKNKYHQLLESEFVNVKLAIIQVTHQVCPERPIDIIKNIINNENNSSIKKVAIRQLYFLGGEDTLKVLNELKAKYENLKEPSINREIDETIKKANQAKLKYRCT